MAYEYDRVVFIGRMRPPTRAHIEIIRRGLKLGETMTVCVGSSFSPRTDRNPWVFEEVEEMIRSCFGMAENGRLDVQPIMDHLYNDPKWIEEIQTAVYYGKLPPITSDRRVALIGHAKDNTSFYLKLFPQWSSINVENIEGINASDVRHAIFDLREDISLCKNLERDVAKWLLNWSNENPETVQGLFDEFKFLKQYKEEYGEGPFLTGDGVVVQSGHVLMIRRGDFPGKGLLALPGGFMEPGERLVDCAIRETYEETRLDVPRGILERSMVATEIFDHPYRDPRARIITMACLFDLNGEIDRQVRQGKKPTPTKIKAASDAKAAMWVPLGDLRSEDCFADHWHVIQTMISKL